MLFQLGQWHWKQEPILIPLNSLVQSTTESCNISAVTIRTIALKTRADSHSSEFPSAKHSRKLQYKCCYYSDYCTQNKNTFSFHCFLLCKTVESCNSTAVSILTIPLKTRADSHSSEIFSAKPSRKLQYKCCYISDPCTQNKSRFSFHCFRAKHSRAAIKLQFHLGLLHWKQKSILLPLLSLVQNSRELQYNCSFTSDYCTENRSPFSFHCFI